MGLGNGNWKILLAVIQVVIIWGFIIAGFYLLGREMISFVGWANDW
jgi:hypothetical protein